LGAAQLNAVASVPGTFTYKPAAGKLLKAGTYTLSATFTPTDLVDYTTASASVTITVTPATPVLTWATPVPIPSGTALSATQLNASANVPGKFVYNPAKGTVLPVGSNTLSVTFSPNDTTNYTQATASVVLTVVQPSFSLSASPTSLSVARGNSGTTTLTVTGTNDFAGKVHLDASGMPSGVTAAFSVNSATTTSVLTLKASNKATTGSATITITGTSGSLSATTTVALTID
jgi:hypothetical protein